MPDGVVKVLVAVADVDAVVKRIRPLTGMPARTPRRSIPRQDFPDAAGKTFDGLTSLNYASDRFAIVIDMIISRDGSLQRSDVFGALVRNRAKLAYNSVAAWLEGTGPMPDEVNEVEGLAENLRLQDRVAQQMKEYRHEHGALTLETIEARLVFDADELKDVEAEEKNRAKDIIENFMIAANGVTSRFLASRNFPSLRRIVRRPKRWDRIIELASERRFKLPAAPDPRSWKNFLAGKKPPTRCAFPICPSA